MRPVDLAREHGISTQAVRNYEESGVIPSARRSRTGYRSYTATHAAGLAAYLALIPAHGYSTSRRIMRVVTGGRLDEALEHIDAGHVLLVRDRNTLRTVEDALVRLGDTAKTGSASTATLTPFSIGELARHLGVSPATMRSWERAGVLDPGREQRTGHRRYLAADVRDAELAHLLRRGGQAVNTIATVLTELRSAGSVDALAGALEDWRDDLTSRGLAQLHAASRLSDYLDALAHSSRAG